MAGRDYTHVHLLLPRQTEACDDAGPEILNLFSIASIHFRTLHLGIPIPGNYR